MAKKDTSGTVAATEVDYNDFRIFRIDGPIVDAAEFNGTFGDPGDGPGFPDLAEPGETIRDKPVFGLTGDWDPTRPGDNNVRSQIDSGLSQDVSDGIIRYGFLEQKHATG